MEDLKKYQIGVNRFIYVDIKDKNALLAVKYANNETDKEKKRIKRQRDKIYYIDEENYCNLFISDDNPVEFINDTEIKNVCEYAISKLTINQQRLIRAIYYEDLTLNQYAQLMGLNYKTVWECHKAALKKLFMLLNNYLLY